MKEILLIAIFLYAECASAESNKLTICMDDNWFPYSIVNNEVVMGIHTDLVKQALSNIDVAFEIKPKPWGRCLKELKIGKVDAVYPASYKDSRASFSHYPANSSIDENSPWRLSQVEHVLVTKDNLDYEYAGDLLSIPQPIGMGISGAFTDTLESAGVKVKRNKSSEANIEMLILGRVKSVALNPLEAAKFYNSNKYRGKLKIHRKPLRSKSYFLVFSKKSNISEAMKRRIWNSISAVRENENIMPYFIYRYLEKHTDINVW